MMKIDYRLDIVLTLMKVNENPSSKLLKLLYKLSLLVVQVI